MPQRGIEQVLCQDFSGLFILNNSETYIIQTIPSGPTPPVPADKLTLASYQILMRRRGDAFLSPALAPKAVKKPSLVEEALLN
jgi:hypothetical protein